MKLWIRLGQYFIHIIEKVFIFNGAQNNTETDHSYNIWEGSLFYGLCGLYRITTAGLFSKLNIVTSTSNSIMTPWPLHSPSNHPPNTHAQSNNP